MTNNVFLLSQELCGNGGVLFLAQSILKLSIPPKFIESPILVAAVSRLKAKILSIVSPSDGNLLLIILGGLQSFLPSHE